jgi:mono/diheme cytochrome c family protein
MAGLVEGTVAAMTQDGTTNPCGNPVGIGSMTGAPTGQVIAVAYSQTGVLFAQTREPAALWRGDTRASTPLASDWRTDTGHLIFHANAGGGLACASCHPEGGEDGRTWNFVCAGARRTQSIRGGISQTAPFHWDGSEHDFSHLMDDVFSGRMAGPMLSADQKTALQSWVDTIPAMPPTANLDSAAVVRGAMVFDDAKVGCASCHAGSLLTNNATVDVGTGQAMQVPSLRGVSWRAPFMHNGCAQTLADRFSDAGCSGGDRHGVTSTLTAGQIGDLTAYLQSL